MCSIIDIEQLQTTTPGWQYGGCRLGNSCYLPEYNGNINNRADISDYVYTEQDAAPHAVTGITDATGTLLPKHSQSVSYTPFNKVSHIGQRGYDYFITYGPDRLRRRASLHTGMADDVLLTKYYAFGDFEKEATPAATRHLHYIQGGDGLAAVYVKNDGGTDSLYYIMKDHLGSITGAINKETGKVYRQNFDAWGRKRNPQTWTYDDIPEYFPLNRGFTGHEHLKWFGLINMNGRMYDAGLCRFLSPDPYVQMPDYSQNFNRYSYALNNPLVYTDPDGEWLHLLFGAIIVGTTNWLGHGAEFSAKGLGYFGIGALAGGLSAGVGAGIGAAYAGSAIHSGGFAAGFLGTATISSTGFVAGAISGTAAGLTNGLIVGSGNKMMSGQNFIDAIRYAGFEQALLQGAAGFSYGGLMGSVDAMKNGEDWLTGGPRPKINMITDGKDVITQDQASSSDILQKKGTINLPVTNEEYAIEIKAPKGYRMTGGGASYVYGNDKLFHKMIQVKNNSQIITFPFGTPYGGAYGAIVERSARVINVHGDLVLFFANKRSYSTLFWYLSLLN
ncbi:MAG: RHS repeat-associated core domain-containing protein [Clostridia bacterium]|jgi:RHS repeat-associated protein|nr:RHS repeat-associated core domain-containing protein [Clostridia bacterium]